MNIVITGGAGFLGALLARTLLQKGELPLFGAAPQKISRITLLDRAAPPADLMADARVRAITGDLNDMLADNAKSGAVTADTAIVFHLAAAVSGECEKDFDLGMRSNFAATNQLLEVCRGLGTAPALVFASSLAVFGSSAELAAPPVIDDLTLPTPQTSYGIQKYIAEQLVSDYTRKGFIRGRSVRLMTVSVRPGKPNGAASGFLSGMIREPLAGLKGAVPAPPESEVALSSPGRTIEGIICAASVSDEKWGPRLGLNLPAITTTVRDMAAALERVAGKAGTDLLDWTPDPLVVRLVKGWPGRVSAERARGLGLMPAASFDEIVEEYVRENPGAIKIAVKTGAVSR